MVSSPQHARAGNGHAGRVSFRLAATQRQLALYDENHHLYFNPYVDIRVACCFADKEKAIGRIVRVNKKKIKEANLIIDTVLEKST